jgi:hypothetical protein
MSLFGREKEGGGERRERQDKESRKDRKAGKEEGKGSPRTYP